MKQAYQQAVPKLQKALGGRDFASAADRAAMAPAAVPALSEMVGTLAEMEAAMPQQRVKIQNQKASYLGLLYALGDAATIGQTDAAAKDTDSPAGRAARVVQVRSQWIQTNATDLVARGAVVETMRTLDTAHPDDELLTLTTFAFLQQSTDAEQKKQLQTLLTETLKNPVAAQFADYFKKADAQQQQAASAAERTAAAQGQPMTLAGTTADGEAFTTAAWKGKVVLVDFWATWCGPCKAELPRVKAVYAQYHAKGLEVLGVSCDNDLDALKAYVAKSGLTWPSLFDAQAAANQQLNPIAAKYGIDSIPRMFLIDKKGVCRSVTAREDFESQIPKLLAE